MQDIALPSFSQYGWFQRAPVAAAERHLADVRIPETFSEDQARFILALANPLLDREEAAWLLDAWTPARFSASQVDCALALLDLDVPDLPATLADAMEPGPLRGQLMRGRMPGAAVQVGLHQAIAHAVEQRRACRTRLAR